jgi:hypothetical protein
MVIVSFNTAGDDTAGDVLLKFSSKVEYRIWFCIISYIWTPLPTQPPSTTDKVWKITLSKTSGTRVIIHCNNVEVLNLLLSDKTCSYSSWSKHWTRDVEKIAFDSNDRASDYYRPGNYNVFSVRTVTVML